MLFLPQRHADETRTNGLWFSQGSASVAVRDSLLYLPPQSAPLEDEIDRQSVATKADRVRIDRQL